MVNLVPKPTPTKTGVEGSPTEAWAGAVPPNQLLDAGWPTKGDEKTERRKRETGSLDDSSYRIPWDRCLGPEWLSFMVSFFGQIYQSHGSEGIE